MIRFKKISWVIVLLIILCVAALQWQRTAHELNRLDSSIYELQRDLEDISNARTKLPELNNTLADEMKSIQMLHKRIPSEPELDSFLATLKNHFKKNDFTIEFQSSAINKHSFYDEIQLKITSDKKIENKDFLMGIFQDIDRYVKWEYPLKNNLYEFELTIYSSDLKMKSSAILPCPQIQPGTILFWPFSPLISVRNENIQHMCSLRDSELGLLAKVKKIKNMQEYRLKLGAIAFELEPHQGK